MNNPLICGCPCTEVTCRPCPWAVTAVREWVQSPVLCLSHGSKSSCSSLQQNLNHHSAFPTGSATLLPPLVFFFCLSLSLLHANSSLPYDHGAVTPLLFLPRSASSMPSRAWRGYCKVERLKALNSVTSECSTVINKLIAKPDSL